MLRRELNRAHKLVEEGNMYRLKLLAYFVVTGLAAVLGLMSLSGCEHHSAAGAPETSSSVPKVTVVRPTRQTIKRLIQQPGYIRPYEQTPIYSKIAGYVEQVTVDKGSQVHKGDLLVKLWVPEMVQDLAAKQAQVEQAGAQVRQSEEGLRAAGAAVNTAAALVNAAGASVHQAEADYLRWTAEFDRAQRLLQRELYDKQTMAEAKNQMQQSDAGRAGASAKQIAAEAALIESKAKLGKAQADLEAARSNLQVAEAQKNQSAAWLDYRNIRAPFDGMVTLRNVHTGHFLQSSSSGSTNKSAEPLLVMMRMDIMRITVQVPEKDAVLVKDGDLAHVAFQALPGRVFPNREPSSGDDKDFKAFPNKVTLLSWSFDDRARTLSVEIHIANPTGELRPGMYANVTILAEVSNALTLPAKAVLESILEAGAAHYCFMVVDGKAVRLPVQVGVSTDKVVQVLQKQAQPDKSGKEGIWEDFTGTELIVGSNPGSLIDGQPVMVEEAPKNQVTQGQAPGFTKANWTRNARRSSAAVPPATRRPNSLSHSRPSSDASSTKL
jgi:HlyD family secretion protein